MLNKNKLRNIIFATIIIAVSILILVYLDMHEKSFKYEISIINKALVYAVIALSMNIAIGFTGLFSLGQAGFLAIGAYVTAILTISPKDKIAVYYVDGVANFLQNIQLNPIVAILLGGLIAAFVAAILGIPVLRLKSDYLAIATLGFAEIIRAVIATPELNLPGLKINMNRITNGSFGLKNIPNFKSSLECFIYCLICIILMIFIIKSTIGRDFRAVKEDEIAAQSVGINIFKTKELSFILSSFFTGIGGGLLAMYLRSIESKTFSINLTYEILLMVVLGGIGSISGSIVGSFLVNVGKEVLRFCDQPLSILGVPIPIFRTGFRMVIYSVLLMIIVLFFRKGIMGGKEFSPKEINRFFNWLTDKCKGVTNIFKKKKGENR